MFISSIICNENETQPKAPIVRECEQVPLLPDFGELLKLLSKSSIWNRCDFKKLMPVTIIDSVLWSLGIATLVYLCKTTFLCWENTDLNEIFYKRWIFYEKWNHRVVVTWRQIGAGSTAAYKYVTAFVISSLGQTVTLSFSELNLLLSRRDSIFFHRRIAPNYACPHQ